MSETELTIIPPPQIHLGSLPIRNPTDLVAKATEMANSLAQIITTQNLYKVINGRKYVVVEGWTTLGAMMGIVPIEEFCRPLPPDSEGLVMGFEAKVKLIRAGDGGIVGAASSECTYDEANWKDRDSYALRSMSITRATGKAYRLSFSWIMKLAGFEACPAEEMDGIKDAKKPIPAPQTSKPAEVVESVKEPPNVYLEPGKQGFCTITGEGLSIMLGRLYETEKTILGLTYDGSFWTVPIAQAFRFADTCVKHGVGVVHVDPPAGRVSPTRTDPGEPYHKPATDSGAARTSAPNGRVHPEPVHREGGAQPSPASPSKLKVIKGVFAKTGQYGPKSPKNGQKWELRQVVWGDSRYATFNKDWWPLLEAGKGKPAILSVVEPTEKGKDGLIDGILRIGDTDYELIEGKVVPVIQR